MLFGVGFAWWRLLLPPLDNDVAVRLKPPGLFSMYVGFFSTDFEPEACFCVLVDDVLTLLAAFMLELDGFGNE